MVNKLYYTIIFWCVIIYFRKRIIYLWSIKYVTSLNFWNSLPRFIGINPRKSAAKAPHSEQRNNSAKMFWNGLFWEVECLRHDLWINENWQTGIPN